MERDEAKAILELCRPGILDDREDPMIAEALAFLETDAKLNAWFEEQQALDDRIANSLNSVEPPADLKASILAGMRAHSIKQKEDLEADKVIAFEGEQVTTSTSFWRQPWVGIAAALVLLFVVITVPQGKQGDSQYAANQASLLPELPATIEFLADEINSFKFRRFDKKSNEPATLKSYLASVGSPSPTMLPKPLEGVPSLGCYTLDFEGIKMSMICFKEDQLMHLTTIYKNDCRDEFPEGTSIYESVKHDQSFKVWRQGDHIYILSIHGEKEELPGLI